jgi:hypothetical protein
MILMMSMSRKKMVRILAMMVSRWTVVGLLTVFTAVFGFVIVLRSTLCGSRLACSP